MRQTFTSKHKHNLVRLLFCLFYRVFSVLTTKRAQIINLENLSQKILRGGMDCQGEEARKRRSGPFERSSLIFLQNPAPALHETDHTVSNRHLSRRHHGVLKASSMIAVAVIVKSDWKLDRSDGKHLGKIGGRLFYQRRTYFRSLGRTTPISGETLSECKGHPRSSGSVPGYSRSGSRNSESDSRNAKFLSRNGISRLEQYENLNSRSNSRSNSHNSWEPT